jgi:hypothetical protein
LDQLYPGNALANSNPPAGGTVEVDLDGLMDELTTNKHTSQKPAPKVQSKQAAKPKAAKPAAKAPGKQAPSQMDDDLDSLINDLTDNGPGISNQKTHGAAAGDGDWEEVIEDEPAKPTEIDDDLDSLIGDLTGGTPAASQAPAKPKTTPRVSNQPAQHPAKASAPAKKHNNNNNNNNDIDDGFLDELMGDLTGQSQNNNNKKPTQPGPGRLAAASVSVDSIEIAEVGNLDSLMDELTAEPQKQPVKQQGRAQPQQKGQPQSARGAQKN